MVCENFILFQSGLLNYFMGLKQRCIYIDSWLDKMTETDSLVEGRVFFLMHGPEKFPCHGFPRVVGCASVNTNAFANILIFMFNTAGGCLAFHLSILNIWWLERLQKDVYLNI